ncbi:hypothetical protein E3A20_23230, partial [Planctomyces bekefii]
EWDPMPSVHGSRGIRAGFYLSQHPAYNARYETYNFSRNQEEVPWMLTVQIKRQCLQDRRWMDLRQTAWQNCYPQDFERDQPKEPKHMSPACEQEISSQLRRKAQDRMPIGIIRDFWWDKYGFWYITDPDCIESMDATPEGYLHAATMVPEFWRMAPFESELSRTGEAFESITPGRVEFFLLLRALEAVQSPDLPTLENLKRQAQATDIYSIRTHLLALSEYATGCHRRGRYEDFRQKIAQFLSLYSNSYVAPDEIPRELVQFAEFRLSELLTLDKVCGVDSGKFEPASSDPKALAYLKTYTGYYKASAFKTKADFENNSPTTHPTDITLIVYQNGEVTVEQHCRAAVPCNDMPRTTMQVLMGQTNPQNNVPFVLLRSNNSNMNIMMNAKKQQFAMRDQLKNVYFLKRQ